MCQIVPIPEHRVVDALIRHILRLTLWHDRRGQDMIEYALMAAFVTVSGAAVLPLSVVPSFTIIWSKVQCVLSTVGNGGTGS